eukprot:TRINITY_DN19373_c0_g1_i1.p1 TRINITY_DN19373_c0_g1~~TRINITY_DN19373_c0_g1_i1.p1  ORF type:complete len:510 (-),score=65.24 TRINITY_DN19373_c0_g1_i1:91-1503(-)
MAGAVLTPLNYRLDANTISVMLRHSEAKAVFVDHGFISVVHDALSIWPTSQPKPWIVLVYDRVDPELASSSYRLRPDEEEYETFVQEGSPDFQIMWPLDETSAISLNYTSGTTSSPKGVIYSHRAAYLNAIAAAIQVGLSKEKKNTLLWTLPMFHCNGWCYTWGMAAVAGTNICFRQLSARAVYDDIVKHNVTFLCGAPIVLNMIVNAQPHELKPLPGKVIVLVGAAPPPPAVLSKMELAGFEVMHGYGLTEVGGPATICDWKSEWDVFPLEQRAALLARQGVKHLALNDVSVMDPQTMTHVPRDGKTLGEVMLRGNTIMAGYFKDVKATSEAFHGGWFHTGDIGVMHPDGYLELKDRSKDIIISGGENISSIEVDAVLFTHPRILEAAVVARPDKRWGETPCAFVTLKDDSILVSEDDVIQFCRSRLPHYMVPRTVVFGPLPKTSTGKIQKSALRATAKNLDRLTISKL